MKSKQMTFFLILLCRQIDDFLKICQWFFLYFALFLHLSIYILMLFKSNVANLPKRSIFLHLVDAKNDQKIYLKKVETNLAIPNKFLDNFILLFSFPSIQFKPVLLLLIFCVSLVWNIRIWMLHCFTSLYIYSIRNHEPMCVICLLINAMYGEQEKKTQNEL